MTGRLEARDLTGPVEAAPSCLRTAPEPDAVIELLHDESRLTASGVASVAEPTTQDELRRVLRWHAAHQHRVTVSGARTGVTGGAVPDPTTHLVSLRQLRGVVAIDLDVTPPEVRALAGTTLRDLQTAIGAGAPGWVLPLDPTEASASVGGMVATNAAGSRAFRFGATRDWVAGLTVELVSGRTLMLRRSRDRAAGHALTLTDGDDVRTIELPSILKPRTKNAIGYAFTPGGDAADLFIGSEGTLGVVSEVTFRLMPHDESRLAFLQFLSSADQAFTLVDALRSDGALRTTAIEFLDARAHELARETGKPEVRRVLARAPAQACSIFAEFGYRDESELDATIERVLAHVARAGGDEAAGLAGVDDQVLHDMRVFRHAVPECINATIARRREQHPGLHKVATDMAVERRDLRWVYELYSTRLVAAGLDHAIFGHVGDNHFHVNILPANEAELQTARAIYAEFAQAVVARGGCVAAEHGIGRVKKPFLLMQYDPATLDAMRSVKRWADPGWRLNPGVLIDP